MNHNLAHAFPCPLEEKVSLTCCWEYSKGLDLYRHHEKVFVTVAMLTSWEGKYKFIRY